MRTDRGRPLTAVAGIAIALGLASCSGTEPRVPTTVSISPSPVIMTALGETQVLTASVLDQHGKALGGTPVWSSTDTTIVRIDSTGVVRAIAVGSASVLAVVAPAQGSAAVTVAQVPAAISVVDGDAQTGAVGVALARPIVVKVVDSRSNPIPSAGVTFTVTGGGGSVNPPTAATGATGQAQTTWTMGPVGPQTLTASTSGGVIISLPAAVNATSSSGTMSSFAGSTSGQADIPVNVRPAVRILAGPTPVAGVSVTFAVASGGGSGTGLTATTNASGVAQAGSWTLGPGDVANTLTATSPGITGSPVTFTAQGMTSTFNVTIQNVGPPLSAAVQTAFDSAVAKWQRIIYQDIPDVAGFGVAANTCFDGQPDVPAQTVDDVLILVQFDSIDGPFGTLASAGPCFIRTTGRLTVMGSMAFDTADVAPLVASGELNTVILHEMGHVLGFGTLWSQTQFNCLQNASSAGVVFDTFFGCLSGRAMFDSIGGTTYTGGNKVPVENCGPASPVGCGAGTFNGHWREPTFATELMTGYINSGVPNPLSRLTVASFEDLGYVVSYGGADIYSRTFTIRAAGAPAVGQISLGDDMRRGPIYEVDAAGRVVGVIPPGGP